MHGYQVMQELEQRSGGRWRPSPGSVYPTLQQLEDEQLVSVEELDGRRTFRLTEAGAAAAASLPRERGWTGGRGSDADLRGRTRELAAAALQVSRVGSPAAIAEARRGPRRRPSPPVPAARRRRGRPGDRRAGRRADGAPAGAD